MDKLREQLKLYAVTDEAWVGKKYNTLEEQIKEALEGGITFLQLREKNLNQEAFVEKAKAIKKLTDTFQVPLIINDNVEVAVIIDADGVHLGQDDMNIQDARKRLGKDKIIGVSAHNVEEALLAEKMGADYLGVGAVFGTSTKKDANALPEGELRRICDAVSIPVVAIGGVNKENILELTGAGVAGAAIVSGIFGACDVRSATIELGKLMNQMLNDSEKLQGMFKKLSPHLLNKKGIIFDMDGTLLDSLPMWSNLDVEYMGRYGIVPDENFHHNVATMTLIEASQYIKEVFDIPKSSEEICKDFQAMVYEEYKNHLKLKTLAYELVKTVRARGYKIIIATANECELSEPVLERTGLGKYVDGLVSCTMVGASKEKPDVYLKACEMMDIKVEECVVFEDSLRAMQTAKSAGFTTIGVYDAVVDPYWNEICLLTDEQVVFE